MGTFDSTVLKTGVWNGKLLFNAFFLEERVEGGASKFTTVVSANGSDFETSTRGKMVFSLGDPFHKFVGSV